MTTRTLKSARDPQFMDHNNNAVHLMVVFEELEHLGELPFCAHLNDVHEHGAQIYARALSGEFGPIRPSAVSAEEHLVALKKKLCAQIDRNAHVAHHKNMPEMQSLIYAHKLEEAKLVAADPNAQKEDFPFLSSAVPHEGVDIWAVARAVCASDTAWRRQAAAIENKRLTGKASVNRAIDEKDAHAAHEAVKF